MKLARNILSNIYEEVSNDQIILDGTDFTYKREFLEFITRELKKEETTLVKDFSKTSGKQLKIKRPLELDKSIFITYELGRTTFTAMLGWENSTNLRVYLEAIDLENEYYFEDKFIFKIGKDIKRVKDFIKVSKDSINKMFKDFKNKVK